MLVPLLAALTVSAPAKGVLLVDMLAIGRLENGKWRNLVPKQSDPVAKQQNISFQNLGLVSSKGSMVVPRLDLQTDVADGWYAMGEVHADKVLWAGTPAKFPAVQVYSPTAKAYLDVVQNFLNSKGHRKAKAKINKVVGVDLDGDGVREVVIDAAPLPDMVGRTMEGGQATDYTAVLIRWVKNGKAVTTAVRYHDGQAQKCLVDADSLRCIVDLNGDGIQEIIVSTDYYEGQSATVFNFKKGVLRKLVENGAGV